MKRAERIVLSHVAEDRTLFARGALTGADWLIGKPPGGTDTAARDQIGLQRTSGSGSETPFGEAKVR